MNIKTKSYHLHQFVTCTNSNGMEVTLSTCGASIYAVRIDGVDQILTPKSKKEFCNSQAYFGKTLGLIAGRLKDGKIQIGDRIYRFPINEGNNALHGGTNNLSFRRFLLRVHRGKNKTSFVFRYVIPLTAGPYFCNMTLVITYDIFENENTIEITYSGRASYRAALNLSTHCYFTLGVRDVEDLLVTLKASHYFNMDDELITLDTTFVDTAFDFRSPHYLGDHITDERLYGPKLNGYDHKFIFDNPSYDVPKAVLESDKFKLSIYSQYDSAIMYSDNYPSGVLLNTGHIDSLRSGLTIEMMLSEPRQIDDLSYYLYKTKYVFTRK